MVPVKTNSNWLPSIFNDFFENEWLAKTGVTAPAINVIENLHGKERREEGGEERQEVSPPRILIFQVPADHPAA